MLPKSWFKGPKGHVAMCGAIFNPADSDIEKQDAAAINSLQKAVKAEDNLIYNEPRDWPIPARHYLAAVLLKDGKYNEAITILNKDLTINPNNAGH